MRQVRRARRFFFVKTAVAMNSFPDSDPRKPARAGAPSVWEGVQAADLAGAAAASATALRLDACDVDEQYELGAVLWEAYDYRQGSAAFEQVLAHPASQISQIKAIARRYFSVGRFQEAAAAIGVAVERLPDEAELRELYAGALERNGRLDAARDEAERATALYPASPRAARLLAHIDRRMGRLEAAESRLREHLRRHPSDDDWRLRYELAPCLDRMERYREAWDQLAVAKEQLSAKARPHLLEGYRIRDRQWEAATSISDADLRRWTEELSGANAPPHRLTFMAGFPRSGTTLLEQLIAGADDCLGTDETGILASQFTADLVWRAKTTFDAMIEIRSLDRGQLLAGRETYLQLTESFLGEKVGSRRLIEKEPLLTPDFLVPLRLFPDASLIMPLRDPRDVVVSYFFTMAPLHWNSAPAVNVQETARYYVDCLRHWLLLRDRIPWPHCTVRYEDLVADPAAVLSRVAEFLGVPWDEAMLDDDRRSSRKAVRTPSYVDVARPITQRSVARWRHYEEQLSPVLELLAPYVREFGYA